ncbi:MAG TPA: DNA-formamidopyrimidine glycosylase family protein [Spirochaetia bacterium]|nr:DNA-formamidopyrimidine glycosylase family protein [Spirochaetia bacterium]
MPELPDLHYIVSHLRPRVTGRTVTEVLVREPIVIRMLLPGAGGFADALPGRTLQGLTRRGPFLVFPVSGGAELILHCMLAGRLQIGPPSDKAVTHLCFTLYLDNGEVLRYGDEKKMGKVYLTPAGSYEAIPGYREQGVDILSAEFTPELFEALIKGRRHQARVFLMDQSALSAIGNAYADEILFAARIHPKTPCSSLSAEQRRALYDSIRSVMAWGIAEVQKAAQPIEVKVRDHVKVRNRKDEPCPVCGTKIRRVGVLGYDSFFCPQCQAASRPQRIPW